MKNIIATTDSKLETIIILNIKWEKEREGLFNDDLLKRPGKVRDTALT